MDVIENAVKFCQEKNALAFASLFADNAQMILSNNHKLQGSEEILEATKKYFSQCHRIKITLTKTTVKDDEIIIEWDWLNIDHENNRQSNHNTIVLKIDKGNIIRWQEYN